MIQIREVEPPVPGDREVLVRVHASTICAADYRFARALRSVPGRAFTRVRKKPLILGMEFSGTVEAVGQSVMRFLPREEVFGMTGAKFAAHAELARAVDAFPQIISQPWQDAASSIYHLLSPARGDSGVRQHRMDRGHFQAVLIDFFTRKPAMEADRSPGILHGCRGVDVVAIEDIFVRLLAPRPFCDTARTSLPPACASKLPTPPARRIHSSSLIPLSATSAAAYNLHHDSLSLQHCTNL
jgi:hypothetical protein